MRPSPPPRSKSSIWVFFMPLSQTNNCLGRRCLLVFFGVFSNTINSFLPAAFVWCLNQVCTCVQHEVTPDFSVPWSLTLRGLDVSPLHGYEPVGEK